MLATLHNVDNMAYCTMCTLAILAYSTYKHPARYWDLARSKAEYKSFYRENAQSALLPTFEYKSLNSENAESALLAQVVRTFLPRYFLLKVCWNLAKMCTPECCPKIRVVHTPTWLVSSTRACQKVHFCAQFPKTAIPVYTCVRTLRLIKRSIRD